MAGKVTVEIFERVVKVEGEVGENGERLPDLIEEAREAYRKKRRRKAPKHSTAEVEIRTKTHFT